MYWTSIIYLISWPVLVLLSYFLVKWVIKKYTPVLEKIEEEKS